MNAESGRRLSYRPWPHSPSAQAQDDKESDWFREPCFHKV